MTQEQAVKRYGAGVCREAFYLSQQGYGPSNIGAMLNLTTRQADCAIDAGRELHRADIAVKWAREDSTDLEDALLRNLPHDA